MEEKICTKCLDPKSLDRFWKNYRTKDGLCHWCKDCTLANQRKNYTPKKGQSKRSPEAERKHLLKKFYGLTIEQYNAILVSQDGHCAICPETTLMCVDHDHSCCPGRKSCGKCIRGLLCSACNKMLGNAKDSITTLRAGITYLEKVRALPYG